ncbi:sulfatase family protein [Pelagibacterium halotolerans]|uniref:Mucin-desulfating sulfatase MdsA n=1 Tax=Pelagibacterium halotolerans (strain DSM 22347 / JCM 15775 / CGMCC 1.7692 / B2) TaxID=1082931 RepID=G4R7D5_PELHB|nr:sulfatase [Pelagibacterium halotolerans]AEQ51271.1 mucin-desulfating sulfatase MdsA precursor [Pelagibacterium halotolerans B2]QJR18872.1 sulfatase [Pelagibacterium halotolerans]SEA66779.1 Arylsulfatase A [Pelagibacterium halotolerans]
MEKTSRPNIIFIMSDDHAARAISAYGGGLNSTPNLDRLANEGMRHDRTYVTNSICTPSRAAILTGTYNHVNCVTTLATGINNNLPNVAKHLRFGGYRTGMFGKWHLGEGKAHEPTGFDEWCVLPGQGDYFDPAMIGPEGRKRHPGYATDIITDMSIDFIERAGDKPFFLMCHHKAPHRNFQPHPKDRHLWEDEDIPLPETFNDDYSNRAAAAAAAKMRIRSDMVYGDLGLVQPEGGAETAGELMWDAFNIPDRKVPELQPGEEITVVCADTGKNHTFTDPQAFAEFKYQRYMKRYLRTVQSIDDNVGRMLDYLDERGLSENTIVIYTSDQGFFLGEHGWFDKRFMYEESLQMPFLVRYPAAIAAGSTSETIACNVDFAPTFLDYAGLPIPTYMQGRSMRPVLEGSTPEDWDNLAYHRYWMHNDGIHEAWAHYGVRNERYKLIYWYNKDLGQLGARPNNAPPEWELFDCEDDPFELVNQAANPQYREIFKTMLARLDAKMQEIGDIPEHDSARLLATLAA